MYDITKDFKCIIGELNIEELNKLKKLINGNSKASKLIIIEIDTELHKREGEIE